MTSFSKLFLYLQRFQVTFRGEKLYTMRYTYQLLEDRKEGTLKIFREDKIVLNGFFVQELTNIYPNRGSTNVLGVRPIIHFWNHASLTIGVFNVAKNFNHQSHFEKKLFTTDLQ